MKIAFLILAIFTLFGMFGTEEKSERKTFMWAYIITVLGIVALFLIDLAVYVW